MTHKDGLDFWDVSHIDRDGIWDAPSIPWDVSSVNRFSDIVRIMTVMDLTFTEAHKHYLCAEYGDKKGEELFKESYPTYDKDDKDWHDKYAQAAGIVEIIKELKGDIKKKWELQNLNTKAKRIVKNPRTKLVRRFANLISPLIKLKSSS